MLNIAVCEDEENQRQVLIQMIKKNLNLSYKDYEICGFSNGEQLILAGFDFDIFFLDIKMGKLTGIEVAEKIRKVNVQAIIIFITALKDYVFNAFDVMAFNYLLKPVDEHKLKQVIFSALLQFQHKDKYIVANSMKQKVKISVKDIMYIEAQQRKIRVHTNYDVIEYYHKLADIEKELSEYNFFRCHKSYIVNLMYVNSYEGTVIILKNSERIYVSKYKLLDFSKAFMYYLKNKEQ